MGLQETYVHLEIIAQLEQLVQCHAHLLLIWAIMVLKQHLNANNV